MTTIEALRVAAPSLRLRCTSSSVEAIEMRRRMARQKPHRPAAPSRAGDGAETYIDELLNLDDGPRSRKSVLGPGLTFALVTLCLGLLTMRFL